MHSMCTIHTMYSEPHEINYSLFMPVLEEQDRDKAHYLKVSKYMYIYIVQSIHKT